MRVFASLLSLTIPLIAQRPGAQRPVAPPQIALEEVLSWLPADTETVIGSNGPFRTLHTAHEFEDLTPDELRLAIQNQPLKLLGLDEVGLGALLQKETVRLAVEGSRHFRSPTHLGPMVYEGCEIAVFTRDLNSARDSLMKKTRDSGARVERIEEAEVAELEVRIEDDTWTIMVAFPLARVVLVATDANFLREVLRRMRGGSGPRALPGSLPEWKYVKTNGSLWALRHFDKTEQINDDPSTPFRDQRAANTPDNDAIGVVFYLEPLPRKRAHVVYLSGARARDTLLLVLDPARSEPVDQAAAAKAFKVLAPGVIELSVPLDAPQTASYLMFVLGGLLGHATYL